MLLGKDQALVARRFFSASLFFSLWPSPVLSFVRVTLFLWVSFIIIILDFIIQLKVLVINSPNISSCTTFFRGTRSLPHDAEKEAFKFISATKGLGPSKYALPTFWCTAVILVYLGDMEYMCIYWEQHELTNALDGLYLPCVDHCDESLPRRTCAWRKSCWGLPFTHDGVGSYPMGRWHYIGCLYQGETTLNPLPLPLPSALQITLHWESLHL